MVAVVKNKKNQLGPIQRQHSLLALQPSVQPVQNVRFHGTFFYEFGKPILTCNVTRRTVIIICTLHFVLSEELSLY